MQDLLYNPFEYLTFQPDICFLTGKEIEPSKALSVPVFPEWLIKRYHLEDAQLTMLNWNKMRYTDMVLPASKEVVEAFTVLDSVIQKAFESGYEAVVKLPEIALFQWMSKITYGVLYQDLNYTKEQQKLKKKPFRLSALMEKKFKNLLYTLNAIIRPVVFNGFRPWSVKCCRVNVSKDVLNYKDETHKLNFCWGMNGFGIVACLQDNGEIGQYYQDLLQKIGDKVLHPAQFEELYGRFMYANYLLREFGEYELKNDEKGNLNFSLPENRFKNLPKYAKWDDKIYAQVLTNMWDPWGIPINKIYDFPDAPISYLINEITNEIIPAEKVNLDY